MESTKLKFEDFSLSSEGAWFPRLGVGRKRTEQLAVTPVVRKSREVRHDANPTVNIMDLGNIQSSFGVEVEGEYHFAVSSHQFQQLRELLEASPLGEQPVELTFAHGPRERELSRLQVNGQLLSEPVASAKSTFPCADRNALCDGTLVPEALVCRSPNATP